MRSSASHRLTSQRNSPNPSARGLPAALSAVISVDTINAVKIECDLAKDASNRAKHGVSLGEAERLDWDEMIATEDRRPGYGERRMIGMSRIGPRLYVVVFTEHGNACASSACGRRTDAK